MPRKLLDEIFGNTMLPDQWNVEEPPGDIDGDDGED
jgi:hypothetical protein